MVPYVDVFQCYAKGSWYGKNVVEALHQEVKFVDKNIFVNFASFFDWKGAICCI